MESRVKQYLELLREILNHGVRKPTRTLAADTRRPLDAVSIFGYSMRFPLESGFPLVTTKKMPWKAIVHELLWFLSGSTNIDYLKRNKVSIWDEWADKSGEVGPIYGKQWRSWSAPDGSTVDQIQNVIDGISVVNENPRASAGRRLLVSAWNVADLPRMAIAPCHTLFHFNVTHGRLDCLLYQRSADVFLGVPFNIASYSLLTHLIAHLTGLQAGEFIHFLGDTHLYENHIEQAEEQIKREPLRLPELVIAPTVKSIDGLSVDQFTLLDYRSHPPIKGDIAI
jgi:thymidylate synthase